MRPRSPDVDQETDRAGEYRYVGYDERIPEDVRKATNYFYDELVRILADGDAGTLGL